MENKDKVEELAANIYASLVVQEFYKVDALDYEDLKIKAKEAAEAFFSK